MTRLASAIAARPGRVVAAWLLLALAMGALGGKLADRLGNGGLGVPGSQSDTARKVEERNFADARGTRLFVAYTAPRPDPRVLRVAARRAAIALKRLPSVASVELPVLAADARALVVPFRVDAGFADAQKRLGRIRRAVITTAPPGGEVEVIGEAAAARRYTDIARKDLGRAEALSFPAPMALLLLAFLSVVAAGLPIVAAVNGLLITFGALYLLSLAIDMSVFATNTAVALGIALSI